MLRGHPGLTPPAHSTGVVRMCLLSASFTIKCESLKGWDLFYLWTSELAVPGSEFGMWLTPKEHILDSQLASLAIPGHLGSKHKVIPMRLYILQYACGSLRRCVFWGACRACCVSLQIPEHFLRWKYPAQSPMPFHPSLRRWTVYEFFPYTFLKCRAKSCPTLRDPINRSLPGSSVHGILQARILAWIAISLRGWRKSKKTSSLQSSLSLFKSYVALEQIRNYTST